MIKEKKKKQRQTVGGRRGKEVPLGLFPLKLFNQIELFIFKTINSVSFLFIQHHNGQRGRERRGFLSPSKL